MSLFNPTWPRPRVSTSPCGSPGRRRLPHRSRRLHRRSVSGRLARGGDGHRGRFPRGLEGQWRGRRISRRQFPGETVARRFRRLRRSRDCASPSPEVRRLIHPALPDEVVKKAGLGPDYPHGLARRRVRQECRDRLERRSGGPTRHARRPAAAEAGGEGHHFFFAPTPTSAPPQSASSNIFPVMA